MSQALYTAMSGISAATTDLEVISNNVANINTTAFKSSSVNFSDVYSTTISYGSVAAGSSGGTNPIQVGVGTQVSAVSKDFNTGSATATGKSTDFMIQGSGFFTVRDAGSTFYTRAGDFSWDNTGNLVTSDGYKVSGTDSILSSTGSTDTVYAPTSIISVVKGNPNIATQLAAKLNNVDNPITVGTFTITSTDSASPAVVTPHSITLAATDLDGDVTELIAAIQTDIGTPAATGITVGCANGTITFTLAPLVPATLTPAKLVFGAPGDTSNFVTETDIGNAVLDPVTHKYTSKILDYTATITDVTSAAAATSINSLTVNADGSIQATYADGNTLSTQLGADGATYEFVFTTAKGVKISGTSLSVSPTVAVPANFVMQLATITNTDGLISVGSNLFEAGPNSGSIVYTVGKQFGAGAIKSGYLEASNVDLSEQLSSMILAQRAIQANSRVFTTVSDTMNTIVQMGR